MSRRHPTLLIIFFVWVQVPTWAYSVKGQINLAPEWERKIYLSLIPSFDDLNTASEELLLDVVEIAPNGTFFFQGINLPQGDRLYRLHVCKVGDPAATLFIGGQEQNHCHFIMNNDSELTFKSDGLFQNVEIKGSLTQALFSELKETLNRQRKALKVNTQTNRENRKLRLRNYLMAFSDSCSRLLPAIYAFSQLDLEWLERERPEFFNRKLEEWAIMGDSPYFQDLHKQADIIRHKSKRSSKSWLMEGLVVLGMLLLFFLFRKKLAEREDSFRPEADLSVQERRVLKLLSGGKSNKEISDELHIEVSTVKSHVSKIYSKLGVRSRKEVVGRY